jgi:hypothetical protein
MGKYKTPSTYCPYMRTTRTDDVKEHKYQEHNIQ